MCELFFVKYPKGKNSGNKEWLLPALTLKIHCGWQNTVTNDNF